jgi:hypothetical protein
MTRSIALSIVLVVHTAIVAAQDHSVHLRPASGDGARAAANSGAEEKAVGLPSDLLQYGAPVAFGSGTIRTVVATDNHGKPTTLGVSFSASALEGLPAEPPADDIGWLYRLSLPSGIAVPPYNHVAVYWNPGGHEPHGVYDVPHIDVHFFLTSPEEADGITAIDRDLEKCYRLPPANTIAPGYILPPNTQHRRMGVHWIDADAQEFKGQPFTASFLYGSYDHQINFLEPMIARAFLASRPNLTKSLVQPAAFARAGWYPSTWVVRWDGERGEYLVLLDRLTWRDASLPTH